MAVKPREASVFDEPLAWLAEHPVDADGDEQRMRVPAPADREATLRELRAAATALGKGLRVRRADASDTSGDLLVALGEPIKRPRKPKPEDALPEPVAAA